MKNKPCKCIIPKKANNKNVVKKATLRSDLTQTMRYYGESSDRKIAVFSFTGYLQSG